MTLTLREWPMTTETFSTNSAPSVHQDTSCEICGKLNKCRVCWNNDYLEAHTCRWCNRLNADGEGHEALHGHFCGTSADSVCAYLFYEWLDAQMRSHMGGKL